ncbi:hypothetical protein ACIBCA_20330 [Kitasatospora sp. NPDC051170]|uniref:hypothetical protein n=1 Tax=Kitasatospora sp. NPDC051170 TaxID=3364056 RepID=UPI0037AA83C7
MTHTNQQVTHYRAPSPPVAWTAVAGVSILTGRLHTVHTAGLAPGVFVIGFVAFFSLGASLGVCSFSYQRRTGRGRS